jgi:hypothetical protein
MNQTTIVKTKIDEVYELGTWVGRKQAFAELAGRCSAADAECLRQARDGKQYRALKMSWEEFCKRRMGISRVTADKLIQRLEEFGPQYFTLAQATGIKPEEYRRIQGSVRGQALLHAGEEIPIQAENAPRLAAAVAELRRGEGGSTDAGTGGAADEAATKAAAEIAHAFEKAERGMNVALKELERLVAMRLPVGSPRLQLMAVLGHAAERLRQLYEASWK